MNIQHYIKITSLIFNFCFIINSANAGVNSDSIKSLPQINKEFLIICHDIMPTSNDSSLTVNISYVNAVLNDVNQLFSPIGVSFKLCTDIELIYNFQYDSLDLKEERRIVSEYGVDGIINFYFIGTFQKKGVCGKALLGGVNMKTNATVYIKKDCISATVIGHELGHLFGLEHTFETSSGKELANSSNCKTAGDKICDTPADPYVDGQSMSLFLDQKCTIVPNKDTNGDYYNPDVSNIMSYYGDCYCLRFTTGQYNAMVNYYLSNPIIW